MTRIQQLKQIEAVDLGHLNVKKNEIRFMLCYRFNAFKAIVAFLDDFDVAIRLKVFTCNHTGQRFVVNEYRFDHIG